MPNSARCPIPPVSPAMANALGRPGAVDWLGAIGPSLLGIASVLGLYYALARVGQGTFTVTVDAKAGITTGISA